MYIRLRDMLRPSIGMHHRMLSARIPNTPKAPQALENLVSLRREPSCYRALNIMRISVRLCTAGLLGHIDEDRFIVVYLAKLECLKAGIPDKTVEHVFPERPSCRYVRDHEEFNPFLRPSHTDQASLIGYNREWRATMWREIHTDNT